jgi:hypothetical protein
MQQKGPMGGSRIEVYAAVALQEGLKGSKSVETDR